MDFQADDRRPATAGLLKTLACCGLVACGIGSGCDNHPGDDQQFHLVTESSVTTECGPGERSGPGQTQAAGMFVDISDEVGLDFQRAVGPPGTYFLPEINGSGGAMFDYDGDGDLDIYLVNSGPSPHAAGEFPPSQRTENRLFRQEADGTLLDVTADSGLGDTGYGIGCAIGDVDNDGDPDVLVTNFGRDRLFLNDGHGHFRDATDAAGLQSSGWANSAAFCDYDRDGRLDLFITHYGTDSPESHRQACNYGNGQAGYCSPAYYDPSTDLLLHNEGPGSDGVVRFRDVTTAAKLHWHQAKGAGFCVVAADFNRDGWPDFYVANDLYGNRLWINQQDGTFKDLGAQSGAAFNRQGLHEASMGLAMGDVDSDGDLDLLATHITDETNTLYLNRNGQFHDVTQEWKLELPSRRHTGWGVALIDLDHDGFLDIPLVNGLVVPCQQRTNSNDPDRPTGVITIDVLKDSGQATVKDPSRYWSQYDDRNQVFFNTGHNSFLERTDEAGDFSRETYSGRALIYGDFDNDGDLDLLVTTVGGRARLYRNDVRKTGHWLRLKVTDPAHRRDAYGAEVIVVAGDHRYHRFVNPASSYLASNDPRVHVGLKDSHFDRIDVRWPDGSRRWESFAGGDSDREIRLTRGGGTERADDPTDNPQPATSPGAPGAD